MTDRNLAESSEELQRWAAGLQQQAQRYNQLQEQLDATSTTERSPGGEVTVTVDSNGVLTALELSEKVRGMEPASISTRIMRCLHGAQAKLRQQVTELVHDTVGDDGPGNTIVQQYQQRFPDPPGEEQADAPPAEHDIGRLAEEHDVDRREPQRPAQRQRDDDPGEDDDWGDSILR